MKLCKNCRYSKNDWFSSFFNLYEYAVCTHPASHKDPSMVDGKTDVWFCSSARSWSVLCGKDAKHFKPKEEENEVSKT